ncbi:N-6 DNA methylase [Streptomyces somaliensis DSM 40738]|uniref:N-6 DNA methylase n=1 Tax=Streptomyces somaliensis (strain ATCC 33201 / DSM 40738 / JCM 12659 / KCTC 9044 / NCTC 11332 / NRRL B-12077 / IP 733) TaxID=1134445 RepID=A0AA44ICL9_STRE0|nr:N-6 DNA methylase [Streptomyces somaliensis DSM 40738]
MTAAEISRIAGVTRATVSNWRRRHDDFPAPSGGTDSSPLYDLEEVRAWLAARGQPTAATPSGELRTTLRLREQAGASASDLLVLVLAAARRPSADLTGLLALPDADLVKRASDATAEVAGVVPDTGPVRFAPADTAVLRALLLCVRDEGAQTALGVLAERELEDSAASGAYRTPAPLADLLAGLVPGSPARVLDPACGSGTLLTAAAALGARELYGQDSLPVQARRTAVGLTLAAGEGTAVTVRTGDSLRADAFPDLTVDAVLCNPPYGDRDWGHDELAYDSRWAYGVPPRAESELAWVQHALAHLEPGGHAVLLLPPATASRSSGRRVRAELIRSGALRAVAALPPGAAVPLHIGLQVWVLQRPEPTRPAYQTVLFVDTAGEPSAPGRGATRSGSVDWARVTERVLSAWTAYAGDPDGFEARPGVARAVGVVDLLDDVVDVTPARQVRASRTDVDPRELAREATAAREGLAAAVRAVAELAGTAPWDAAGASAHEWRTATVADLARGGALRVLRAVPVSPRAAAEAEDAGAGGGSGDGGERRPVLTGGDIARGTGPSGQAPDVRAEQMPEIAEGDVLVRNLVGGTGPVARVAGEAEAGALLGAGVHLFRPDPVRLDPWFLLGFLGSEANLAGASTGSSTLHLSPGRLRVPLLPLAEQRRYGEAFRHVEALREQARRARDLAEDAARLVSAGLTGGQLVPHPAGTPEPPPLPARTDGAPTLPPHPQSSVPALEGKRKKS